MHKRYLLGGCRLFFGLVGLSAVVVQFAHQLNKDAALIVNFFSFFTIESNLLAVGLLLALGTASLRGTRGPGAGIRGAVTLYMLVTGIIYVLLLSAFQRELQTTIPWVNTVVHYIMPIVMLADWCIDLPRRNILFSRAMLWLIYPFVYLTYSLVRGHFVSWYPYPFLNADKHGYLKVGISCAVIALGFVALTWLLARSSRLRHI